MESAEVSKSNNGTYIVSTDKENSATSPALASPSSAEERTKAFVLVEDLPSGTKIWDFKAWDSVKDLDCSIVV
jgi:hypothetical protein